MDKRQWSQWWRKTGRDGLREILFRDWDPYRVADFAPPDEYDAPLMPIARLLLEGATEDEVAGLLRSDDRGRDRRTARALKAWYSEHGPEGATSRDIPTR
jgi:hypothetical protein